MRSHFLENTLSLVGGAGLGAALMYLFDPDLGSERRQDVRDTAGDALASTGEALKGTVHAAGDTARSLAGKISQYAHNLADDVSTSASSRASDAMDSARDAASNVGSAAMGYLSSARKQARAASSLWSRASSSLPEVESSHPYARATGISAGTIGVLALGAGLMYFMDPDRGRGRRAWARDKIFSVSRRTGRQARSYGRHLRNELKGATHQAQQWTADNWLGGGGGQGEQGSTSESSMPSAGAGGRPTHG
jgi:gas vesicle protein